MAGPLLLADRRELGGRERDLDCRRGVNRRHGNEGQEEQDPCGSPDSHGYTSHIRVFNLRGTSAACGLRNGEHPYGTLFGSVAFDSLPPLGQTAPHLGFESERGGGR